MADVETIPDVILEQCNKLIKKIDKKLMRSLKREPLGYGEYKIKVNSKDMKKFLMNYYEGLGYEVSDCKEMHLRDYEYDHYLKIKIKGWYDED